MGGIEVCRFSITRYPDQTIDTERVKKFDESRLMCVCVISSHITTMSGYTDKAEGWQMQEQLVRYTLCDKAVYRHRKILHTCCGTIVISQLLVYLIYYEASPPDIVLPLHSNDK